MGPLPGSRDRVKQDKTSVRFNEVAMYFSEEEWRHLEAWQKQLYSSVMMEIHSNIVSLGYGIAFPDVLCRIKEEQYPSIGKQEKSTQRKSCPSTSTSVLSPDVLFRIKIDDEAHWTGEHPTRNCSTKSSGKLGPHHTVTSMNKEIEEDFCCTVTKKFTPSFGNPMEIPVSDGGETNQNLPSLNIERDWSPNPNKMGGSQLVFNPKFSLWIKQVEEPTQCSPNQVPEDDGAPNSYADDKEAKNLKSKMPSTSHPDKPPTAKDSSEHFSNEENADKKRQPTLQPKNLLLNKPESSEEGEESLLSIVLKRANAGSLYVPSYKYFNNYGGSEYSGKRAFYHSTVPSLQTPKSDAIVNGSHKSLSSQQAVHDLDKPYRCNSCEKCFKTVGILNVHSKTHTGVRPYQCNECGKGFRDNWNLKVHQKIHTGETPYKCPVCDKGFIQYATYMKHQRVHTGERPYACCYCDKCFTNSSNLVRHHRTHTGEKPYGCGDCGKTFSYNTSLIQHKRIHRIETLEVGRKNPGKN
ncbi:uncharacterized protein RCH25_007450 [Pelodytes ibericus]